MNRGWLGVAATAGVALSAPRVAHAGRTDFTWLYDTDVVPERGVELEQWISEEDHEGPSHSQETHIQWGPVIGITDKLQLSLPVDVDWSRADGEAGKFTLDWFRADLRYRLVSADPVEAPALVPLLRVAVDRNVVDRGAVHVEADVVASYTAGRIHAGVDLRFATDLHNQLADGSHDNTYELEPGAGVSVSVVEDLRLGAEVFGQAGLASAEIVNWWAVGPDLAWTHGRFWLSATMGIGVYNIHTAPRVIWGIAF